MPDRCVAELMIVLKLFTHRHTLSHNTHGSTHMIISFTLNLPVCYSHTTIHTCAQAYTLTSEMIMFVHNGVRRVNSVFANDQSNLQSCIQTQTHTHTHTHTQRHMHTHRHARKHTTTHTHTTPCTQTYTHTHIHHLSRKHTRAQHTNTHRHTRTH